LASQNADGSWGDTGEPDVHTRYHTAWTAIDGLRDYAWSERTEWPAAVREVLLRAVSRKAEMLRFWP
jgi:hypothetical protein